MKDKSMAAQLGWHVRAVAVVMAFIASGCGGGGSSSPTAPSARPAASVIIQSLAANTERAADGNLSYVLTFAVRESGGVAVTIATITLTLTSDAGTATATLAGAEALTSNRVAAGATVQSNQLRLRTDSAAQASRITVRANYTDDNGNSGNPEASASVTPAVAAPAPPGPTPTPPAPPTGSGVVINEFRSRGSNGATDEFIELRNDSSNTVDIGGWRILGSNGSGTTEVRRIIDSGITLASGCHFLLTNSNTPGYSGGVSGDTTYGVAITDDGGIAVARPDGSIVDQVGMSSGSAYREGTPLSDFGDANTDRSYTRIGNDTNNNRADFTMRSPSTPQNRNSSCTNRLTPFRR